MQVDFFKEGKGVSPNEPEKSRFVKFFLIYGMRFWKLISLNLLYLTACIPLVTIGPATVAMANVLRRYSEEKLAYVWADFFETFRSCFQKALLYSLLYLIPFAIAGYAVYFYFLQALQLSWTYVLFGAMLLVFLCLLLSGMYAAILIGSVELSLRQIIKNSLILSVIAVKQNFSTLLCWLIGSLCIVLLFPASMLLVLLFLPATMWYAAVYILNPVVKKYCVQQEKQ